MYRKCFIENFILEKIHLSKKNKQRGPELRKILSVEKKCSMPCKKLKLTGVLAKQKISLSWPLLQKGNS